MRISTTKLLAVFFLFSLSNVAIAHPGHDVSGFSAGLMHPFSGIDHLLAMLAVGLWAAQGGGKKIWLLPATFMSMLAIGAAIAMRWPSLPLVEAGIATSVLALGLLVALSLQLPATLSMAITALFGLLHGYAHGLELPGSASPTTYAPGFLAATATLHLIGIAMGVASRKRHAVIAQALGIVIAVSGVYLLTAA